MRRRVGLSTRTGANTPCWRQPVHSTQTTPCSRNAACWRGRTRSGQGSRLDRGGRGRTPTKDNSQTRLSSSTSLRTQGRATTPVRWRQSTPNHCRRPLRRLIRCRSSHGSRRCASSMAKMRQSREISLPARCHRWNAVTFETPVYHGALWLALFNKVWQRRAYAPHRSLIDCNGYIESKRSSVRIHSTLRQGEEWEIQACRFFFHVTSRTGFYSVPVTHRIF